MTQSDSNQSDTLWQQVEAAVQYRGDVTIIRKEPLSPIEGFVFDKHRGQELESSTLSLLQPDNPERQTIPLPDIVAIELTGRDAAAGKSFESWVKKYLRRKYADQPTEP